MHLYTKFSLLCSAILVLAASSCVKTFDVADINQKRPGGTNVGFDIKVTREGEEISAERQAIMTKGDSPSYESNSKLATMDSDIPFGLIGIDYEHHALVVDNESINSDGSNYGAFLNSMYWDDVQSKSISFKISFFTENLNF